jgi:multisubunit Na+/H+ antiporter MnhF subunit
MIFLNISLFILLSSMFAALFATIIKKDFLIKLVVSGSLVSIVSLFVIILALTTKNYVYFDIALIFCCIFSLSNFAIHKVLMENDE